MPNAEERRKARINKILANSEQRLKKITGVEQKSTVTELDNIKFGTLNNMDNYSERINGLRTDSVINDNEYNTLQEPALQDQQLTERLTRSTKFENGSNSSTYEDTINNMHVLNRISNPHLKLIHIFILAIIQNCLFSIMELFEVDYKVLGNIFLPLIAYEIFHCFSHFTEISIPPYLSLLFKKNITKYLKYLMLFFQVMQDIMIYFFIFIVIFQSRIILKIINLL